MLPRSSGRRRCTVYARLHAMADGVADTQASDSIMVVNQQSTTGAGRTRPSPPLEKRRLYAMASLARANHHSVERKSSRVLPGKGPRSDVSEGHCRSDRNACPWIGATHNARHIVAN